MAHSNNYLHLPETADRVIFYVCLGVLLTNVPLVVYAFVFRHYPPIRSTMVWIVLGLSISSIFYNVSSMIVNGMLEYKGPLANCQAWGIWTMTLLGFGMFLSFIVMRTVIYWRIFVTGRKYGFPKRKTLKQFWCCHKGFVLCYAPAFISCIIAQSIPDKMTAIIQEINGVQVCSFNNNFLYWSYAYYAAILAVAWGTYFNMHNIAFNFTRFRPAIWSLSILTTVIILNIVLIAVGKNTSIWGRRLLAFYNTIFVNSYIWMQLWVPITGHLFCRQACLQEFLDMMKIDSLAAKRANLPDAHKCLYCYDPDTGAPNLTTHVNGAPLNDYCEAEKYISTPYNAGGSGSSRTVTEGTSYLNTAVKFEYDRNL